MKIERINDNQIRCTLTSFDLSVRNLNLRELAYGSEKARGLFREMIQKASNEVGFEAEDIPLMVEAIPLSNESVMLVITKIEDPEELDTRFSKFAPSAEDDEDGGVDPDDYAARTTESTDSIFDLFRQIQESRRAELANSQKKDAPAAPAPGKEGEDAPAITVGSARIFAFSSMHNLIRLAHVTRDFYDGKNSLYKNTQSGKYSLVISEENISAEAFNRICNVVSEYGRLERSTVGSEAYFKEHYELISDGKALQMLAQV